MKKYIFGAKNGIYIIDLQQTIRNLRLAYEFIKETVSEGGKILFVGTKRQIQDVILEEAARCQMFYVNLRWLGGTLTNFHTVRKSVEKLRKLEEIKESGQRLTKKELARLNREYEKLSRVLGGIKEMSSPPAALFVADTKKEQTAVREAQKLEIPIVGIVDTNCDPEGIDYVIPANDDAIKSVRLITSIIANACLEGQGIEIKKAEVAEEVELITTKEE